MENIKQIFLIGMMGSGKSTVGSMLANKLNWTFIDIDTELEKEHGLSIQRREPILKSIWRLLKNQVHSIKLD